MRTVFPEVRSLLEGIVCSSVFELGTLVLGYLGLTLLLSKEEGRRRHSAARRW